MPPPVQQVRVHPSARVYVVDALIAFLLLYNISFLALPSLTTGRVALMALALAHARGLWRATIDLASAHVPFVLVYALLVLHAALLQTTGTGTDSVQLSRLLNFGCFVLVGTLALLVRAGGDLPRILRALTIAVCLQSVLVLVSYLSPGYRAWLATLVIQGGNIPLTSATQAPGFSNSSGAALSVVQAAGVFTALYATRFQPSARVALAYGLAACLNAASTVLVGRTGFALSLAYMGAFLVAGARPRVRALLAATVTAGLIGIASAGDDLLAAIERQNPSAAATIEHTMSTLRAGLSDPSVVDLMTQPIPPLSLDTTIGTGRVVGEFGNASGHDSGYVQTYFALGLVGAVVFYGAWLALLSSHLAHLPAPGVLGAFVAAMFLIEIKEPFIFKYAMPMVVLVLTLGEGRFADVPPARS
jgi:hypothetical protein